MARALWQRISFMAREFSSPDPPEYQLRLIYSDSLKTRKSPCQNGCKGFLFGNDSRGISGR
jgi:hypothetical protein